ncbi:hypothetical protein [Howardella ureilytica]
MAYGYIAKLNEQVIREHVRFNDRYGIAIAADVVVSASSLGSDVTITIQTD